MKRLGTLIALLAIALPVHAQGPDAGSGARFGLSFGGISTVGLTVELFNDSHSIELGVGTWSFRDVSVAVVARQYFGAGAAQPFVSAGLWTVIAFPPDERAGAALVLRAPIGVDWGVTDRHSVGAALSLNRALAVRRTDPLDEIPLNERLVPLPELFYKLTG